MSTELYKKYRPKKLRDVVGQDAACKMLLNMLKTSTVPHALLFHGPSGCGKTTLARILRVGLGCSQHDFKEVNCADFRGIDMVRDIRNQMVLNPMGGRSRVWLIDEAHQLSSQAQNAFLKILEDTPEHVYFMLASTDPQKLIAPVRTRCTDVGLKALNANLLAEILTGVAKCEKLRLHDTVVEKICEVADGSPRKALVLLDAIRHAKTEEEQLKLVIASDSQRQAIELARLLIKPNVKWPEIAAVIKEITEEPESLRWMVIGYASSVMLNNSNLTPRCALILESFCDNFYDSKRGGLVLASWNVVQGMKNL